MNDATPHFAILTAESNLRLLQGNPSVGEAIIMGLDETGKNLVQVFLLSDDSEEGRNRVAKANHGHLWTERIRDAETPGVYSAMREEFINGCAYNVVGNGEQVDEVGEVYAANRGGLRAAMESWIYLSEEADAAPRLTGVSYWPPHERILPVIEFSMLRKSTWSAACNRYLYEINDVAPGFGYAIMKYRGRSNPMPVFRGEPELMPLFGSQEEIAAKYMKAMNALSRIAVAVKFIPKDDESTILVSNWSMPTS